VGGEGVSEGEIVSAGDATRWVGPVGSKAEVEMEK